MCSVSVFSNAFSNACFVSPLFGFAYVIRSPTVRGLALIVVAAIFDFADMMKHMIDRLAPEPAIAAIARVDDQLRGLAHPLFAVDRGCGSNRRLDRAQRRSDRSWGSHVRAQDSGRASGQKEFGRDRIA